MEKKSDLIVVTKAKDLCGYVMTVTQKSPKQFRFTFVGRMQNLTLDIIECIYRANDIYIGKGGEKNAEKRLEFQHRALTSLKLLAYIAEISMTQACILPKQYEIIAKQSTECMRLVGAWINSDKKRVSS